MSNPKTSSLPIFDTFYILDFDRCLADTDKLHAYLQEIIQRDIGIRPDVMQKARYDLEKSGGSFDTATYVKGVLDAMGKDSQKEWNGIRETYIKEVRTKDMLEPHAKELLALLTQRHAHFGIVTYGGRAWQSTKLAAVGFDTMPYLITDDKYKGALIESWQLADGSFLLPSAVAGSPGAIARSLIFIDDKPVSFMGIPAAVQGICTLSPGVEWPQKTLDSLPVNVTPVKGLAGAIELLFSH